MGKNLDPKRLADAVDNLVDRHGSERTALEVLYQENYDAREDRREARAELDDAKQELKDAKKDADRAKDLERDLDAYKNLGTVDELSQLKELGDLAEVKKKIDQISELEAKVQAYERKSELAEIARDMSLDEVVFTDLAGDLEINKTDDGYRVGEGDDAPELMAYLAEKFERYMPILAPDWDPDAADGDAGGTGDNAKSFEYPRQRKSKKGDGDPAAIVTRTLEKQYKDEEWWAQPSS